MERSNLIVVVAEKPFSGATSDEMTRICREPYTLLLIQGYKDREKDVFPFLGNAMAVIVRSDKVDETFLNNSGSQLKVIVRAGTGYDTIDTNLCRHRGIAVLNTPGQNSNAVAELVFGLLIHVMRQGFSGKVGLELKGRTLGLHGFGSIAKLVAHIAKDGFGMKVCAYDPYVNETVFQAHGVRMCSSLDEIYSTCTVVSIHVPLTAETKMSVGSKLLNRMAPNSIIVNTSRAEIVDEMALKNTLNERADVCYCADVAPKCAAELLEKYGQRVFFTQVKCGAQTEEANANCGLAAIHEIMGFIEENDTTFQVNK